MAYIDITQEDAAVIAQSMKAAFRAGEIDDEYTAFNILQTFKREFPDEEYLFDFLDYEFTKTFSEYE